MEEQIKLLLMSYSVEELLEDNDIDEHWLIEHLVELKLINLEDYYE